MGQQIRYSDITLPTETRDAAVISPFYATGLDTGLLSGRIFHKHLNNLANMPAQPVNFLSAPEQGSPSMSTNGFGVDLDFINYLRLDTAEPPNMSGLHVFRPVQDGTFNETGRIVDTLIRRTTNDVHGFTISYQQFTSTNTSRINYLFNGQNGANFEGIAGNVMSDTPKDDDAWRALAYSIDSTVNTITFWDLDGYDPSGALTAISVNIGSRTLSTRQRGAHVIYGSTLETGVSAVGQLQKAAAFTWNRGISTAEVQSQWLVTQKQLLDLGLSVGIQPA